MDELLVIVREPELNDSKIKGEPDTVIVGGGFTTIIVAFTVLVLLPLMGTLIEA